MDHLFNLKTDMSLIQPKTQLQLDEAADEAAVIEIAEAAHNLAAKMRDAHSRFWARPTERLLAALNENVPATLARFAGNTALGTAVNAALDAVGLPQFATRAPVTMGREDVTFDGTAFKVVEATDPQPVNPEE